MFFLLLAQLQTRTRHTLTHPHTHSLSALHLRSLVRGKGVHGNTTHIHTHTHTHTPLHSHTLTHGYRSQKPAHLSHGPTRSKMARTNHSRETRMHTLGNANQARGQRVACGRSPAQRLRQKLHHRQLKRGNGLAGQSAFRPVLRGSVVAMTILNKILEFAKPTSIPTTHLFIPRVDQQPRFLVCIGSYRFGSVRAGSAVKTEWGKVMLTRKMAALCVEGFLNIPKSTLLDCRHRLTNGFLIQAF